jgi:hypothetical protein
MAQAGTLCWSAVCRDGVTLAECGEDMHGGSVLALAKKILAKKPSPGWEFDKSGGLRACKFHVHDAKGVVWSACCVYTSGGEKLAKGFLEKLAFLTEPLRETPEWQSGGQLAAQATFAPTLKQRMEQVGRMT